MTPGYYGDIDLQDLFLVLVASRIALLSFLNRPHLLRGSKGAKIVVVL